VTKQIVKTDKAPQAIGPYSQGVIANGMLFTAGQIPLDPQTMQMVEGNVSVQTDRVMQNLLGVLTAAGTSFEKVVKATVFLKDLNDFTAFNEVYGRYFPTNPPARSTVQVAKLPRDALVEVELIAWV